MAFCQVPNTLPQDEFLGATVAMRSVRSVGAAEATAAPRDRARPMAAADRYARLMAQSCPTDRRLSTTAGRISKIALGDAAEERVDTGHAGRSHVERVELAWG